MPSREGNSLNFLGMRMTVVMKMMVMMKRMVAVLVVVTKLSPSLTFQRPGQEHSSGGACE